MANRIDTQLERERSKHKFRLLMRNWAGILGNWTIPVVLWSFLLYFGLWNTDATTSQFTVTLIMVPPVLLAALILLKREMLSEYLRDWVGEKLMNRLVAMNQSINNQIGIILLGAAGLTIIGLSGLVSLAASVSVIAAVAMQLPNVKQWLAEEPDLDRPLTKAEIVAEEARYRADRGEVVAEAVVDPAPVVAPEPETSSAAVSLQNPQITEAVQRLQDARRELKAHQDTLPMSETPDEVKVRRKRTTELRKVVTKYEQELTDLGMDPKLVA